MVTRRKFIQQSALAGMAVGVPGSFSFFIDDNKWFSYESPYIKFQLLKTSLSFSFFSTDSLGEKNFITNPILKSEITTRQYESKITPDSIAYFPARNESRIPSWELTMQPKIMTVRTRQNHADLNAFEITFTQKVNHCTVLGVMPGKNEMKFPCVLHFPGMGTFRIYCSDPDITLFYDADRNVKNPFVKIALPAANDDHKDITYCFESVAIYPELAKIKGDSRFDGFRRNFINIYQINPRICSLANNSASDACAFTVFLYAEMARHTPPLAKNLTAMHLVKHTLDNYLEGMRGYGQVGYASWDSEYDSSDSAPSLIISACYYILDTANHDWAEKNYPTILEWAIKMMATDRNNDGFIEYGYSGNSGSWNGSVRPANWWDTIGFGHDDAYSNILAFKACKLLASVAYSLKKFKDSKMLNAFADRLREHYYSHFYNEQTGVLAGWKSADGHLHDYYFTFVNSMAVCFGVINQRRGKKIMKRIWEKMKEVGFTNFKLGLPGNLMPINAEDYTDKNKRWGYDNFQVYENGGATACYTYYFIHALYKLGMTIEADTILQGMLSSYKSGSFQGYCSDSNMTRDWKTWKGDCWGYEGFLVDGYLALLAVLDYSNSV